MTAVEVLIVVLLLFVAVGVWCKDMTKDEKGGK